MAGVLATVGELVEDVVVHVADPLNVGSDTAAVVHRRRGGSAANVAVAAAVGGHPSRFIGRIGDDAVGDMLAAAMRGVDLVLQRQGRSGTIIVLVDPSGERTMLPDPGSSTDLDDPRPEWLDGVTGLHAPAYSVLREPIRTACTTLAGWAHERGIPVSVDASSVGVMAAAGRQVTVERLRALGPEVLLMNEDEAAWLADSLDDIGAAVRVTKRGPGPATVEWPDGRADIPAIVADVRDTTGAGDAFAAGFLTAWIAGAAPDDAVRSGHALAVTILTGASRA